MSGLKSFFQGVAEAGPGLINEAMKLSIMDENNKRSRELAAEKLKYTRDRNVITAEQKQQELTSKNANELAKLTQKDRIAAANNATSIAVAGASATASRANTNANIDAKIISAAIKQDEQNKRSESKASQEEVNNVKKGLQNENDPTKIAKLERIKQGNVRAKLGLDQTGPIPTEMLDLFNATMRRELGTPENVFRSPPVTPPVTPPSGLLPAPLMDFTTWARFRNSKYTNPTTAPGPVMEEYIKYTQGIQK